MKLDEQEGRGGNQGSENRENMSSGRGNSAGRGENRDEQEPGRIERGSGQTPDRDPQGQFAPGKKAESDPSLYGGSRGRDGGR